MQFSQNIGRFSVAALLFDIAMVAEDKVFSVPRESRPVVKWPFRRPAVTMSHVTEYARLLASILFMQCIQSV